MNRRIPIAALATLFAALLIAPSARADSMQDLKKRFERRYPVLLELKEAGKVGETYQGWVEAVKADHLDDEVKLGEEKVTVKALLEAENKDRKTLYAAIAKKNEITVDEVAAQNAVRNFKKAGPEEWLKTKAGWKKKKDLKEE